MTRATGLCWRPGDEPAGFSPAALLAAAARPREPAFVVVDPADGAVGVGFGGAVHGERGGLPLLGALPPVYPEWLGDRGFLDDHGLRFPYMTGAMASGIAGADLVVAAARAGLLAVFGAAGLALGRVEAGLDAITRALGPDARGWASNLIHSPHEPALERALVELYLRRDVRTVEASAFLQLQPTVVRYAFTGLRRDGDRVVRRHRVIAKVSRPEVALQFMRPAPPALLRELVAAGLLAADEAALAEGLPVAEDITAEADSGGHTDNRPLLALLPRLAALRAELGLDRVRLGAAGGLGAPAAVAAAFAAGAAYVVTGSVNQATRESGLAAAGKRMLAAADLADVAMAPAADMFELGARVQVLRRGTLFAARATRLYDLFTRHASLAELPPAERAALERDVFRRPLADVWTDTERFFAARDPDQLARAARDERHKLALVFRWYLGLSSRWALDAADERRADWQIWSGPAIGACNAWLRGSHLERPDARGVVDLALNLLEGAAVVTRAQQLRSAGAPVPAAAFHPAPRPLAVDPEPDPT